MRTDSFVLAVTGGIGAGKSTICRVFSTFGDPVYVADDRAKYLMNQDPELVEGIKMAFGDEAYSKSGELNRRYLAKCVFNDQNELERLNGLVHPAVSSDFEMWKAEHGDRSILIKEVALLFENGGQKSVDGSLLVSADKEIRVARILKRDPERSAKEVEAIMDKQLPEEEKQKRATWVVENNGDALVIPQIIEIRNEILRVNQNS